MSFEEFFYEQYCESDKGSTHDYISKWYSNEFSDKREADLTIVEIGIYRGDFVKLLRKWFTNATLFGIDPLLPISYNHTSYTTKEELSRNKDINFIFEDAYSDEVVSRFKDASIDYIIDDGPHTVESQIECIEKWYAKLKVGGVLLIEDVQNIDEDKEKFDKVCKRMNISYKIIDLRNNKNEKFDDVLIEIRK